MQKMEKEYSGWVFDRFLDAIAGGISVIIPGSFPKSIFEVNVLGIFGTFSKRTLEFETLETCLIFKQNSLKKKPARIPSVILKKSPDKLLKDP